MKRRNFIVVALFLSLILVACGGGSTGTTFNVTMTDFQFQPSQFTVPAGQEIKLNIANNGGGVHSFVIMKLGTTVGDTFDAADEPNVYWQTELQPGASTTTTFTAPSQPGDYEIVCKQAGHIAAGMIAKLTVAPAGK